VVAGIGLNVNQEIFKSDAPNPVSLRMITQKDYNLDEVLRKLLSSIFEKYSLVQQNKGRLIENEYYQAMYRLMEWHPYRINNEQITARITGTSSYGQLMLQTQALQEITCDLKDVKFVI
jgi:BirA family biotin operon repressor/biotin-[acetyl-CoA-carboxylase] ligase